MAPEERLLSNLSRAHQEFQQFSTSKLRALFAHYSDALFSVQLQYEIMS